MTDAGKRIAQRIALLVLVYTVAMLVAHRGLGMDNPVSHLFFTKPCLAENARQCWLINKSDYWSTFFWHSLPSGIFKLCGVAAAGVAVAGSFIPRIRKYRYTAMVLLVAIAVPAGIVSLLKSYTGHYCPAQLALYGGPVGATETTLTPRCFPAGFPAPGFGLLVVYFSALPYFWRKTGLYAGLGLGAVMGIIQLARGEHFLSHIIATCLTALFVGCLLYLFNEYQTVRHRADLDR